VGKPTEKRRNLKGGGGPNLEPTGTTSGHQLCFNAIDQGGNFPERRMLEGSGEKKEEKRNHKGVGRADGCRGANVTPSHK